MTWQPLQPATPKPKTPEQYRIMAEEASRELGREVTPAEIERELMSAVPEPIAEEETTLGLSYNREPVCPHCGMIDEDFSADSELVGQSRSQAGAWTDCAGCGKKFKVEAHIDVTFTTYKEKS